MKKGQRIFRVDAGFIVGLCIQGSTHHFLVKEGLPLDAQVVRVFFSTPAGIVGENHRVSVVVESAEWEALPEGSVIPDLFPTPLFEVVPNA